MDQKGRTVHVKVIFIMNPVIEFSCHHATVVISHGSSYQNYMQARAPPQAIRQGIQCACASTVHT